MFVVTQQHCALLSTVTTGGCTATSGTECTVTFYNFYIKVTSNSPTTVNISNVNSIDVHEILLET